MGEFHPLTVKKTSPIPGRNLIGVRLREIRLAQKPEVTLEDLAGRMAVRGVKLDRSALGRIERQKRYVLDYELVALAKCLRIDTHDLLSG
jgi:transcriptional regulator with XRE-family HTH domain